MRQINENDATKLNVSKNSKKYKIEAICNIAVYTKELKLGYLPKLYYLVF